MLTEDTERLKELPSGTVRVERGHRSEDQYRLYVFTPDGESIDETLDREGLALAWTLGGQHRMRWWRRR